MKNNQAYIIFTRIPTPGKCKTRLIPTYSGQEASDLQGDLLADLLASVVTFRRRGLTSSWPIQMSRTRQTSWTVYQIRYRPLPNTAKILGNG